MFRLLVSLLLAAASAPLPSYAPGYAPGDPPRRPAPPPAFARPRHPSFVQTGQVQLCRCAGCASVRVTL